MRRIVICLLLSIAAMTAGEFTDKTEDDFLQASERCFNREKVPQLYKPKFEQFDYPNEAIVHKFLHCVWSELELWNDRTGFNVEHVASLYKDKANMEILVPIISDCNRNTRNEPPLQWCYKAFKCILESRVGQWFKDDVGNKMKDNQNMAG